MNASNKMSNLERGFTFPELLGVLAISGVILILVFLNFQTAHIKARDEQRKANLNEIVHALERYHKDFEEFPPSQDGKIIACGESKNVVPCRWGVDKLADLSDLSYPAYLSSIPGDPRESEDISFYYLSNRANFQIFAHLERKSDPARNAEIEKWGLACGKRICNYGITLSLVPVTKLLEASPSGSLKR